MPELPRVSVYRHRKWLYKIALKGGQLLTDGIQAAWPHIECCNQQRAFLLLFLCPCPINAASCSELKCRKSLQPLVIVTSLCFSYILQWSKHGLAVFSLFLPLSTICTCTHVIYEYFKFTSQLVLFLD